MHKNKPLKQSIENVLDNTRNHIETVFYHYGYILDVVSVIITALISIIIGIYFPEFMNNYITLRWAIIILWPLFGVVLLFGVFLGGSTWVLVLYLCLIGMDYIGRLFLP